MKTAVAKQSEGFLLTVCPLRVRLLSALTPGAIRHDPFAVSKCCWRVTSSRPHTSPPSLLLHLPSLHLVYDTRLYDITFWLLYLSLLRSDPRLWPTPAPRTMRSLRRSEMLADQPVYVQGEEKLFRLTVPKKHECLDKTNISKPITWKSATVII